MALQFFNESSVIKTDHLTAVIFGEPGIGKTSLANTARNPLTIDFERGIQRSVIKKTFVRVDTWADVIEFQKSPQFKELAPNTLVIDTVGSMLDNYIAEYVKEQDPKNMRRGGELTLPGYGSMKNVFKQFKDWSRSINCNLIFVAHATSEDEGDNKKFIPKLTGGSYDILRQETDLIGYMFSYQNRRVIDFAPKDSHIGKDCAGIGMIDVPDMKSKEYAGFFGDLVERTLNKMNEISDAQSKVLQEIESIRETIASVQDAEKANRVVDFLRDYEPAIQVQCFKELQEHCKGFAKYDSKLKVFENVQS